MTVRFTLFYLILLCLQGFWDALLAPLPAPDFFLLGMVVLVWRLKPWQLVLVAYGMGLLQDIMGHGILGIHALGLGAAALGAIMVWLQLAQSGIFARTLIVIGALGAKWLVIIPLIIWQTGVLESSLEALRIAPIEIVFSLLASFIIIPWGISLFQRSLLLGREA